MSSSLHVVRAGNAVGPRLVFVHGSATDHATWSIQLAGRLRERFALIAYDRRALEADGTQRSIAAQAADLSALVAELGGPTVAIGSSFGAVIVLEALRAGGAGLAGAILCEPPIAADAHPPPEAQAFVDTLDAVAAAAGPDAAAERFLRTVLGDAPFERMPLAWQARAKATWPSIRADCGALGAYHLDYATLASVTTPVLLLGGERSAPYFRKTLESLARALPHAELEVVRGAGHMLHAEASRAFATVIDRCAAAWLPAAEVG